MTAVGVLAKRIHVMAAVADVPVINAVVLATVLVARSATVTVV